MKEHRVITTKHRTIQVISRVGHENEQQTSASLFPLARYGIDFSAIM